MFITGTGTFLPGEPVPNDRVEEVLGQIGPRPSRYRRTIQSLNGITSRHYALDDGRPTHLNEEMAALAVEAALEARGLPLDQVGMLAVGTTIGDLLMPGFASMVHGRLGAPPLEVLSAAGICASGAAALQHAWTGVLAGRHEVAVAGASELSSAMMKAGRFALESQLAPERGDPATAFRWFNAEFLRWMLSDGAGAVVLENRPRAHGLSLRVDWIELTSYAGNQPTCMFLGSSDPRDISPGKTWLTVDTPTDADRAGMLVVRQDTDLLGEHIVATAAEELRRLIKIGARRPRPRVPVVPAPHQLLRVQGPARAGGARHRRRPAGRPVVHQPRHPGQHRVRVHLHHAGRGAEHTESFSLVTASWPWSRSPAGSS